jgi:hypothetical protein
MASAHAPPPGVLSPPSRTALWVALHGYVSLHRAIPDFPWPPDDTVLDNLINRLALLT